MSFFKRETIVEWLARESGYGIVRHEGDYWQVRADNGSAMRYIGIRSRQEWRCVQFQTDLPVKFPVAAAPPDLYRMLLIRNQSTCYGSWCMELTGTCEAHLYLHYGALKVGLTPQVFDIICRDLLGEREGVHDELRNQLSRLQVPTRLAVQPAATGTSLTAGGGQQGIVWVQG